MLIPVQFLSQHVLPIGKKVLPYAVVGLFVMILTAHHYKLIIEEHEKEHITALVQASEKARVTEEELNTVKLQLENETEEKNEQIQNLLAKYNRAVASGKRLRDPGQSSGCDVSSSATTSGVNRGNPQGAELSREASEFLLSESARADKAVAQLKLCQDLYNNSRKTTQRFNEKNNFLD